MYVEIKARIISRVALELFFDAGLATEFMFKKEAHAYYKNGLKGYQDIVQDFHRSRYIS